MIHLGIQSALDWPKSELLKRLNGPVRRIWAAMGARRASESFALALVRAEDEAFPRSPFWRKVRPLRSLYGRNGIVGARQQQREFELHLTDLKSGPLLRPFRRHDLLRLIPQQSRKHRFQRVPLAARFGRILFLPLRLGNTESIQSICGHIAASVDCLSNRFTQVTTS
jgi:hypothetical protein